MRERQVGGAARPPRPPGENPRAADPGRGGDAGQRLTRRAQTPREWIGSDGLHPGQVLRALGQEEWLTTLAREPDSTEFNPLDLLAAAETEQGARTRRVRRPRTGAR